MYSAGIVLLLQLAGSALASPCKNQCNADNCLRAVRASSHAPFPSSATADCSSFLRKTVTPCAATTTTTEYVTVTDAPAVVTQTTVVENTQPVILTELNTVVVTTVEYTVTDVVSTLVVETNTVLQTVTQTVAPALRRGNAAIEPLPTVPAAPADIEARSAPLVFTTSQSTCAATTSSPSAVPTYASACSGTVRYSSACSCAGVTATTITLAQETVTATTTSTVQVTPTTTAVVTATQNVPVTIVNTVDIPTAFETTDATVVVPAPYTTTVDVQVTTTVTVQPACTSGYHLVASSGTYQGQFLQGAEPNPSLITYGFVSFTSDPTAASRFVLRPDGRVYGDDIYGWTTNGNGLYYILQMTDNSQATYKIRSVFCSIDSSSTGGIVGAVGTLSCSSNGSPIPLLTSPQTSNNLASSPGGAPPGSTQLTLAAVPIGCI